MHDGRAKNFGPPKKKERRLKSSHLADGDPALGLLVEDLPGRAQVALAVEAAHVARQRRLEVGERHQAAPVGVRLARRLRDLGLGGVAAQGAQDGAELGGRDAAVVVLVEEGEGLLGLGDLKLRGFSGGGGACVSLLRRERGRVGVGVGTRRCRRARLVSRPLRLWTRRGRRGDARWTAHLLLRQLGHGCCCCSCACVRERERERRAVEASRAVVRVSLRSRCCGWMRKRDVAVVVVVLVLVWWLVCAV